MKKKDNDKIKNSRSKRRAPVVIICGEMCILKTNIGREKEMLSTLSP